MFCLGVCDVLIFRPSIQVTLVRMPVWSVEGREPAAVWSPVDVSSVAHCRLRPPSPVQSSPFLPSIVPRLDFSCCLLGSLPCVLPVFCTCFFYFLFSSISPGFQSSFSVGPMWRLPLPVLSCVCQSQSRLVLCLFVAASKSCVCPLPCLLSFCLSIPADFSSSNASSLQFDWR